jgi:hypothetical protein
LQSAACGGIEAMPTKPERRKNGNRLCAPSAFLFLENFIPRKKQEFSLFNLLNTYLTTLTYSFSAPRKRPERRHLLICCKIVSAPSDQNPPVLLNRLADANFRQIYPSGGLKISVMNPFA